MYSHVTLHITRMLIHAHTVMYALKNICFKASLIALKHDTCNKNNMFSNKLFQKCCMEIQITFFK